MGVGSSKKKKAALIVSKSSSTRTPVPPKPLTAVSEGEEQAWSSVHVEEDKDHELPKPPKKNVARDASPRNSPVGSSNHMSTSTSEPQTRIESATSTEEKEDVSPSYQQSSKTIEEPTEEYSAPAVIPQEEVRVQEEETSFQHEPYLEVVEPTPIVQYEPPPREPTPEPLQAGGYLLFSTVSDGALFLQFSHSKVEGALAYFRPNKIIPAFKFRQNAGRVELIRKLQSNKQGYYEGYADFLKAAKEFDSDIYLIENVARVYYMANGSSVYEAPMQEFWNIRVDKIAVIPPNNAVFAGVKSTHPDQFMSAGNKHGKALRF